MSSTFLRVYENENYGPRTTLNKKQGVMPLANNVILKVPMMFATHDIKLGKEGFFRTKPTHVLLIKSGIENVGIDLLFRDTTNGNSEFEDWIKYVKEAEDNNRRKLNRLDSIRRKLPEDVKFPELVRRQSSHDVYHKSPEKSSKNFSENNGN